MSGQPKKMKKEIRKYKSPIPRVYNWTDRKIGVILKFIIKKTVHHQSSTVQLSSIAITVIDHCRWSNSPKTKVCLGKKFLDWGISLMKTKRQRKFLGQGVIGRELGCIQQMRFRNWTIILVRLFGLKDKFGLIITTSGLLGRIQGP